MDKIDHISKNILGSEQWNNSWVSKKGGLIKILGMQNYTKMDSSQPKYVKQVTELWWRINTHFYISMYMAMMMKIV